MPLVARDVVALPADEAATWVSVDSIALNISVFLLTLVAYDAGAQLHFQVSRTKLMTVLVITFEKEVPYLLTLVKRSRGLIDFQVHYFWVSHSSGCMGSRMRFDRI